MTFERLTKTAVIASALGAVVFEAFYAERERSLLILFAASAVGYAAARKYPARAAGIVLAAGYITPALFLLTIGYRYFYLPLWIAPFLGAMAAAAKPDWQYPSRFRFPLIAWSLAIALTWPIVALRVLDWNPSVVWAPPSTGGATVYAISAAVWVSHVALVHLLGLLWVDWLFGRFKCSVVGTLADTVDGVDHVAAFERFIIYPLLVAATCGALVGAYQGFADLRFLSIGAWPDIGRASGSLADGNASGALSALWVAVALCFAVRARSGAATLTLALSSVVLLIATWTSGSRTSLLCALVGLAAFAHIVLTGRANRRRLLITAAVMIAVLAAAGAGLSSSVSGPLRRVAEVLPGLSRDNIQSAARQLWDRQGYGVAAVKMIAEEPLQGVGVGSFHLLSSDYVFALLGIRISTDNAQNWFRHQLAELGVLGSVGWILWCGLLVAALLTKDIAPARQSSSLAVKYTIAGFGFASLLGMPSQNLFVALTVWTFAFWLLLMVERSGERQVPGRSASSWPVVIAALLAIVFAGTTAYTGWHELRPPFIAKRFNFLYEYGIYGSMAEPAGRIETSGHAVAVMAAPTTTLRLTVWVDHPDADTRPVAVDAWVDHERIIHGHFPRNVPLTRVISVPGDGKRFVLETRVDRTFAAPGTNRRDVGLTVAWEFDSAR